MKIEGPRKSSGAGGVSKTGGAKKTGDSGFSGMIDDTGEAEAEKPISGVANVGRLDALLALQEAVDGTSEEASRKSRKRAASLLDELDKVRMGLLTGGIPKDTLQHLTHMVSQHRESVMDPKLAELLDEIDLRVQVELAKHGR
jgi:hypothetical protein